MGFNSGFKGLINVGGLMGRILNIVAGMDIHLVTFQFRHYMCQEVNVVFYYVLLSVLP